MKKILLILAVSGLLFSACNSNNSGSKTDSAKGAVMPSGPKFKFENDTHDFGKIKQLLTNPTVLMFGCNK